MLFFSSSLNQLTNKDNVFNLFNHWSYAKTQIIISMIGWTYDIALEIKQ